MKSKLKYHPSHYNTTKYTMHVCKRLQAHTNIFAKQEQVSMAMEITNLPNVLWQNDVWEELNPFCLLQIQNPHVFKDRVSEHPLTSPRVSKNASKSHPPTSNKFRIDRKSFGHQLGPYHKCKIGKEYEFGKGQEFTQFSQHIESGIFRESPKPLGGSSSVKKVPNPYTWHLGT